MILQTHDPEHPLLRILLNGGYRALSAEMLDERRVAGLPPFTQFSLLRAEAEDPAKLDAFLAVAASAIDDTRILAHGPMPAPMPRRGGVLRAQILIEAAERDRHMREQLVAQLADLIEESDKLSDFKRGELRGRIADKPGLNRYLRATPAGKLRVDQAKIKAEENLDGKYLLRCSDPHLSAEDIALGYKQLLEVERGWRGMKQIIDLRPVCHRLEERIRAHVIQCWLALLLIRITETAPPERSSRSPP